jgi:hypothetical protein
LVWIGTSWYGNDGCNVVPFCGDAAMAEIYSQGSGRSESSGMDEWFVLEGILFQPKTLSEEVLTQSKPEIE